MKALSVIAIVVGLTFSNLAGATTLKCPMKKGKFEFKSISLFDGSPKENVNLAPLNANSPMPHKWTLDDKILPWLACNYGANFEKLYSKKIKGKIKSCETLESKTGSGIYDSISCK